MSGSVSDARLRTDRNSDGTAAARPRVLIVDDDKGLCVLAERVFGQGGFDTVVAGSVAEATTAARATSIDVALVDLWLPDGNGTDLLEDLRSRDPDLPVIVFTGDTSVDSAVAAVNRGAAAYFLKPLMFDEVVAAAWQHAERRRLVLDNRRLEQELRRELAEKRKAVAAWSHHHAAVEAAAEAIVVTDRGGYIEYVNPAFESITGFPRSEVLGQDVHILDSGHHDESFFVSIRNELLQRGTWSGHLVSRRKDGSHYHESCTISPIRDDDGAVTGYAHLRRDVTEELRLRSVAEAVNTMDNLGYVFTGIRHELGNPVNSATFALKIMLGHVRELPPSRVEEYLERTLTELGKVTRLLGLLRSFEAFEAVDVGALEVRGFIEAFVALSRPDCARRAVALESTADDDVGNASADPRALQQVLLNVLTNALDACEERDAAAVRISAERRGPEVAIDVTDNGVGMTTEQRQTLFRPFTASKADHNGLGLIVCRRLMAQMGGAISVRSEAGRGTTVALRLPVAEE